MVPILFASSNDVLGTTVKLATWSNWSHVALLDEARGTVIEAHIGGVKEIDYWDFYARYFGRVHKVYLPGDAETVLQLARSQIGKPYDYLGLLGLTFRRNWQDEDAWWCSELIAWAFDRADSPLFRADALHRITPQHLWMLSPLSIWRFNNAETEKGAAALWHAVHSWPAFADAGQGYAGGRRLCARNVLHSDRRLTLDAEATVPEH